MLDITKIKCILFDLDNTLIDFILMKKCCVEAAVSVMIDAGLEMGKKRVLVHRHCCSP